jgi:subtilisin-like proprotein convertase family protein
MKTKLILSAVLATALTSQASVFSYSTSPGASVPDANPAGYVSTISVGNILANNGGNGDTLRNVSVTLNLSGGYNGDLYGYLVSPDGGLAILLNRIGRTSGNAFGNSGAGMNITLDDSAVTSDIHSAASGVLSGSYNTDARAVSPLTVLDSDSRTATLAGLTGAGTGTWTLFLADMAGGDVSSLVSWGITLDVVPEPTTWALMIFGAVLAATAATKVYRRKLAV